jgi:phosphoribosylaminoimidazolecarboxamide formyltransferase/IMP cyclohydrolase
MEIHVDESVENPEEAIRAMFSRLAKAPIVKDGRYGENWHAKVWHVDDPEPRGPTIAGYEQLMGGDLGYNNQLDGDAALQFAVDINDDPGVAIIKHTNPCGGATSKDGEEDIIDDISAKPRTPLAQAFLRGWQGDYVSSFGSIVAVNRKLDKQTAELINSRFIEVVIAPDYEGEAVDLLKANPKKAQDEQNLRLIQVDMSVPRQKSYVMRYIEGRMIISEFDQKVTLASRIEDLFNDAVEMRCENSGKNLMVGVMTDKKPDVERAGLYNFGLKAAKRTKSNAVMVIREYAPGKYQVLGMGAGQPNRMDAAKKLAFPKADENLRREYFRLYGKQEMKKSSLLGKVPLKWENAAVKLGTLASDNKDAARFLEHYIQKETEYVQAQLGSDRVIATSDAFFPARDGIEGLLESGIRHVVSPGGSKKDAEVIACANEYLASLVHTGVRLFLH